MSIPTTVAFEGVDRSAALEEVIGRRVDELAHLHAGLSHVRVAVSQEARHHRQGRAFSVRLDLRYAGRKHEVAVTQRHDGDPLIALRDAFDAARRIVQDEARRVRGQVRRHAQPRHGRVARIDRAGGFGFIEDADGREFYFGRDNLAQLAFDDLAPGQPVAFVEDDEGDTPQAKRISVETETG